MAPAADQIVLSAAHEQKRRGCMGSLTQPDNLSECQFTFKWASTISPDVISVEPSILLLGVQLLDKHVWARDSALPEVSSHLTSKTQGQQRTTLEKRNLSNTYLCLSQSSDS